MLLLQQEEKVSRQYFRKGNLVTSILHRGLGVVIGTTVDEWWMNLMFIVLWPDGSRNAYASMWLVLVEEGVREEQYEQLRFGFTRY